MKKRTILIIILAFILLLVALLFIRRFDFNNSTFVITSGRITKELHYYEVNNWKYKRKVNEFDSDEIEIFKADYECYKEIPLEQYSAREYYTDDCTIKDNKEINIEPDENIKNIVKLVNKKNSWIHGITIIKHNDEYYAGVLLNVNLWDPYELYKYDKKRNKLKLIYTFDGEEVIGIKNK